MVMQIALFISQGWMDKNKFVQDQHCPCQAIKKPSNTMNINGKQKKGIGLA
jgi:hypothetical protein